ncbi:hypothetical protein C1I98_33480 [Spongiactinospora gelatinilytica]|uniref:Uncharacterized protein n=1 Tax=Spongiactinospora gelatinilytica TaxID=2666298 RepID=A0A2W2FPT9_9ACTN|nr:hypothetical protein C1I98_33480 [Spongiactinospora gelatinilytica]
MASTALEAFSRGESEQAGAAAVVGLLHLRLAEFHLRLLRDSGHVPLASKQRSSWEAVLREAGL